MLSRQYLEGKRNNIFEGYWGYFAKEFKKQKDCKPDENSDSF